MPEPKSSLGSFSRAARPKVLLDLGGVVDAHPHEQRRRPSNVRRSHAGSVEAAVDFALVATAVAHGLLRDVHPRSPQGHLFSTRGEVGDVVVAVGGAHGDDLGESSRVLHLAPIVAGRCDDDHAAQPRVFHRGVNQQARVGAAQAHVDDLGAVVGCVADALSHGGGGAIALGAEHLDGHDGGAERQASHAFAVVRRLRDRAGHVRPVAVVVSRALLLVDEVGALDTGGAGEVRPLREGRLFEARHARVDHGDRHTAPAAVLPRSLASDLTQVPLLRFVERVVGLEGGEHTRLRLDDLDPSVALQTPQQRLKCGPGPPAAA